MENENRVAVVSGAASGMGRETSILFAKEGYSVVCTDNNKALLDDTVSIIKKESGQAVGIIADITKVDDIKNLAKEVGEKFKKVDVLINCAGLVRVKDLVDYSEDEMDLMIDVNLKGTYRCCKYLLPLMIKNKSGVIINISSKAGKLPQAGAVLYHTSKWGVVGFTKSLGLEVRKYGIKAVVINPGATKTDFYKNLGLDEELLNKFLNPTDIARVCLFVAGQSANCFIEEIDMIPMTETLEINFK